MEKAFGLAAKEYVKELPVGSMQVLKTEIDRSGEDKKGKFRRILRRFPSTEKELLTFDIETGHAVVTLEVQKRKSQMKHMANRFKNYYEKV